MEHRAIGVNESEKALIVILISHCSVDSSNKTFSFHFSQNNILNDKNTCSPMNLNIGIYDDFVLFYNQHIHKHENSEQQKTQLTKLIRAIQIFPLVFQLIVDDTKNISEHNARLHCIAIGIHVSQ